MRRRRSGLLREKVHGSSHGRYLSRRWRSTKSRPRLAEKFFGKLKHFCDKNMPDSPAIPEPDSNLEDADVQDFHEPCDVRRRLTCLGAGAGRRAGRTDE